MKAEKWRPMDTRKRNEEWARRSVRAMLRKLLQLLAEEHERAAAELRKAVR